jgi:NTP pyrophosphatase (non-canonical NTP hydrolase)
MTHYTDDNYSDFVAQKFKAMGTDIDDLAHAAMGISGEAGELLDAIKKHWAYGKPLDRENVIEELGDLEFYMTALRNCLGIPRSHIISHNVAKLSKRYADKYSDQEAIARADKTPPPPTLTECKYCGSVNENRELCYACARELT